MIDKNKVHAIIEREKSLHPNDPRISEIWEELTCVFSENEESTIEFLNNCGKEDLYWISAVFDDVSEHLQSEPFIQCIEELNVKYPDLSLGVDIEYAKMALKTKDE